MAGRLVESPRHLRVANNPTDRSAVVTAVIPGASFTDRTVEGPGSIEGVCTFDGVPGPARVLLLQDKTARVVRVFEAAADGAYEFSYLDPSQTFTVLGEDSAGNYNSVVQARIAPGIPP